MEHVLIIVHLDFSHFLPITHVLQDVQMGSSEIFKITHAMQIVHWLMEGLLTR
jgi:hypothetical protein